MREESFISAVNKKMKNVLNSFYGKMNQNQLTGIARMALNVANVEEGGTQVDRRHVPGIVRFKGKNHIIDT
jgi:hypothetical protein